MSKPKIVTVTFIDPYESDRSEAGSSDLSSVDPDYIPSHSEAGSLDLSVSSEDYSSVESSQYSTASDRHRILYKFR